MAVLLEPGCSCCATGGSRTWLWRRAFPSVCRTLWNSPMRAGDRAAGCRRRRCAAVDANAGSGVGAHRTQAAHKDRDQPRTSPGQREADPGERRARTAPGRTAPPAVRPKQGVLLCRPAQFTLALADSEFFHHVRMHGPHLVIPGASTLRFHDLQKFGFAEAMPWLDRAGCPGARAGWPCRFGDVRSPGRGGSAWPGRGRRRRTLTPARIGAMTWSRRVSSADMVRAAGPGR